MKFKQGARARITHKMYLSPAEHLTLDELVDKLARTQPHVTILEVDRANNRLLIQEDELEV